MKAITKLLMSFCLGFGAAVATLPVYAETTGDKMKDDAKEAGKEIKKGYRDAKQKGCEMINGKLECAGKRAKTEIKDKVNDAKEKMD